MFGKKVQRPPKKRQTIMFKTPLELPPKPSKIEQALCYIWKELRDFWDTFILFLISFSIFSLVILVSIPLLLIAGIICLPFILIWLLGCMTPSMPAVGLFISFIILVFGAFFLGLYMDCCGVSQYISVPVAISGFAIALLLSVSFMGDL